MDKGKKMFSKIVALLLNSIRKEAIVRDLFQELVSYMSCIMVIDLTTTCNYRNVLSGWLHRKSLEEKRTSARFFFMRLSGASWADLLEEWWFLSLMYDFNCFVVRQDSITVGVRSSLLLCCCVKTGSKSHMGEERDCISLQGTACCWAKLEQELKAETWRQSLMQRPWGSCNGLASPARLGYCYYIA